MFKHFSLAFGFILFVAKGVASASILAGPVVDPANGHSYYLLSPSTWTAAEATAVTMGGNLATVRNAGEQNFIFNTFGTVNNTNYSLWIGLYDPTGIASNDGNGGTTSQHAKNFVWVDGEPVTYTNWISGQPDNFAGREYYAHMMNTGNSFGNPASEWNDMDNNESFSQFAPYAGVVEIQVPEPASLGLLATGAAVLLARRRRRAAARCRTKLSD